MPSLPPYKILARWEVTWPATASPLTVYHRVAEALRRQQLPALQLSYVARREGGLFSARRLYLRIRQGKLFFDLCAMPIGVDLQVSWWLCLAPPDVWDLCGEIPVLGPLLHQLFTPVTWYEIDCKAHFQHCVQATISAVLDELIALTVEGMETELTLSPQLPEYYHE